MNVVANLGSPMHWFILVIVCLVVFGAKRLPEIARGLGKGLGEFKKARQEFEDELMRDESLVKKHIASPENTESEASSEAPVEKKKESDSVEV